MSNIEDRELVAQLLDKYGELLTQTQRQALKLYYFEDLSLAEIANITVTSRSAAYDAIKKGKIKLMQINSKINS